MDKAMLKQKEMNDIVRNPEKRDAYFKRILLIVSISQIFGGLGLAAGITVGALIARDMLGTDAYGGVPSALFTLGSAFAAYTIGLLSQKYGRGFGLSFGFTIGGLGAIGIIAATAMNNIYLFLICLLIYGFGTASNLQARYAGTDIAHPHERGRAISTTMVMTTFGAVIGPNSADFTGNIAERLGLPVLTGPFLLSATAFLLAGLVLKLFLKPDPLLFAKEFSAHHDTKKDESPNNRRGIIIGAFTMVLTQIVMVSIMTMTPIHMSHHGHHLSAIGIVISVHIASMYLPSLFTGRLIDSIGSKMMTIASAVILLSAGILSAMAPPDNVLIIAIALGLLGLGWNFGLISGTTEIIKSTNIQSRASVQGKTDVLIALSGASGGMLSGMVVSGTSYAMLSLIGGALALTLIPTVLINTKSHD